MGLSNKRALVTGSNTGLGRAIAEMLATEGASVVVHGRDERRTHEVVDGIRSAGGDATGVIGDIGTAEGAAAVASAAGAVDVLVNNAGYYDGLRWTQLGADDWLEIMRVNVISGVRMIEHLVPGMRRRGWGRVIQIGGGLALQPAAEHPHDSASLAARHNVTVSLPRELADYITGADLRVDGGVVRTVS